MGKPSTERKLSDIEAMASVKMLRTSPRKLNLVAGMIRGQKIMAALEALTFSQRRISNDVKKVLNAAVANAENNHQLDIDNLYVSQVFVGKAMVMKRFRARARGRGAQILKPFSNLKIFVKEFVEEKEDVSSKKKGKGS
jgi:large subunit ribosomal protein L22